MSSTIVTDVDFSPASLQLLREAAQSDITYLNDREEFLRALEGAEILCSLNLPNDLLERAPKLRWLQNPGAGLERLRPLKVLDADQRICHREYAGVQPLLAGDGAPAG